MMRLARPQILFMLATVVLPSLFSRLGAATPTDTPSPTVSASQTASPSFTDSPTSTPTPTVTGTYLPGQYLNVLPPTGSSSGGQFVTITGGVFFPSIVIMFDGVTLTGLTYVDAYTVRGFTPPHAPGPITVTAYMAPFSYDFPGAFSYLAIPSATPSPTSFPTALPQACSSTVKVPGRNVRTLNVPIDVVDSLGGSIALRVFSSHGRFVKDIFKGPLNACQGVSLNWDCLDHRGAPVASGLYILVLRRGEEVVLRRRFIIVQ